jgi:peptidoglycan/LPS O-acetylase OafA/YrhL
MDDGQSQSPGLATGRPAAGEHFHLLDSMRGLAALWVVLFHLTISTSMPPLRRGIGGFVWGTVFGRGALGVAVFFVLSGFVISHSLRRGLASGQAVSSFAVRRVVRLTPPYWAAIVVAVAVHALAVVVNHEPFAPGGAPLSGARVAGHLFYLEGLLGQRYIDNVFWTLSVEMQFYVVLALFLVLAHLVVGRHPTSFRPLVWILAVLTLAGARSGLATQVTFVPLLYSFVLGAVVYWVHSGRLRHLDLMAYLMALATLFAWQPDAFLGASIVTGTIIAAASAADGLAGWLSGRWLRFLGRISYSLYLVHVPVQGAVLLAWAKIFGTSGPAVVGTAVASTAACLVAAVAFWWAVERPSVAWAASLNRRPKPAAPSGGQQPDSSRTAWSGT